jgi:hypothetical protein
MGLVDLECKDASLIVKGFNSHHLKSNFKQSFPKYLKLILIILLMSLNFQSAYSAEISLTWNNTDGATGYKIYYGFESRNYTYVVDIGPWTQCTISGLDNDRTYYFAVTAYHESDESEFSYELTCCSANCDADFDIDGDIDGSDLASIVANPSTVFLNDFAAGFGTENCAN